MSFFIRSLFRRPLSLLAGLLAIALIFYELRQIAGGQLYMQALGYIDGTTVIELCLLGLWGFYTLRDRTDLQAVSFTLVNSLSFIFSYEALYKWSFFLAPFHLDMPATEFRQMVIQIGIALTLLTGFAVHFFTLKKWTIPMIGLFIMLWAFWLLLGYPQLDGRLYLSPVLQIDLAPPLVYALNRATKFVLWLAYLTLFPVPGRPRLSPEATERAA
jgi:type IV secretory pathway TrbD component